MVIRSFQAQTTSLDYFAKIVVAEKNGQENELRKFAKIVMAEEIDQGNEIILSNK